MSDPTVFYSKDYDITSHHKKMLQYFDNSQTNGNPGKIKEIQKKLDECTTRVEFLTLSKQIKNEQDDLENAERKRKAEYVKKTADIIERYKASRKEVHIISILNPEKNRQSKDDMKLLSLIDQYLSIANKYHYFPVKKISDIDEGIICPGCETPVNRSDADVEGKIKCSECSIEIHTINNTKRKKNRDKSSSSQTESNTLDNSLKALKRLQGKQSDVIPNSLLEKIDEYYIAKGYEPAAKIREMELDSNGRRGGTTFASLSKTLKEMKQSSYYNDVHLIGKKLWGWELPELGHIEAEFISIFDKTQKVATVLPVEEKGRSSSLGTQFRNWKQILIISFHGKCDPIPRSEFKIVENPKSLEIQEALWKKMCEGTNDESIIYIENDL